MNANRHAAPAVLSLQPALICFSHLRWDFVLQRPQHLMSRFAQAYRLFFWEEAIPTDHHLAYSQFHALRRHDCAVDPPSGPCPLVGRGAGARAVRPARPDDRADRHPAAGAVVLHADDVADRAACGRAAVVYDCMDELSAFRFAPPETARPRGRADGRGRRGLHRRALELYEAKPARARQHPSVSFPVDAVHFGRARTRARRAGGPGAASGARGSATTASSTSGSTSALIEALARGAAGLVGGDGRSGGEDRRRGPAAAPNLHWLGQRGLRRAARLPGGLGRGADALRDQRGDALHLPDQDARIPGRRRAGGLDRDPRRGAPLRRAWRGALADGPAAFVAAARRRWRSATRAVGWRDEADRLLADESWDCTFQAHGRPAGPATAGATRLAKHALLRGRAAGAARRAQYDVADRRRGIRRLGAGRAPRRQLGQAGAA